MLVRMCFMYVRNSDMIRVCSPDGNYDNCRENAQDENKYEYVKEQWAN